MDALKKLKAQKDALKAQVQLAAGEGKQLKKVELEEARLKAIREEEERERQEKASWGQLPLHMGTWVRLALARAC